MFFKVVVPFYIPQVFKNELLVTLKGIFFVNYMSIKQGKKRKSRTKLNIEYPSTENWFTKRFLIF